MKCVATAKATGAGCRRDAIAGGTVCVVHGGRAPQVKAAAARRVAEQELQGRIGQLLEEMGKAPTPDPIEGLLCVVDLAARMVAAIRLEAEAHDVVITNSRGDKVIDPVVVELRYWLDQYGRSAKLALDAGIDERRVRMSELLAAQVFEVVSTALSAGGLTQEQDAVIRKTMAEGFRALDAAVVSA